MADKLVRQPSAAGLFYPINPSEIRNIIEGYFNKIESLKMPNVPIGILAPHASFNFSAQTAAFAYKQVQNEHFDDIVILGAPHTYPIESIAISECSAYKTPLGEIEVDTDICASLLDYYETFKYCPEAHKNEHSIEMQLPFIQIATKTQRIVPILVGTEQPLILDILSKALFELLCDKKILIVISTDLSHFAQYEDAINIDRELLDSLVTMCVPAIRNKMDELDNKPVSHLAGVACARGAILAGINAVQYFGASESVLLNYCNSGDSEGGDKNSVVGYGSLAFYKSKKEFAPENIQPLEKQSAESYIGSSLLLIARETINSVVNNSPLPNYSVHDKFLLEKFGAQIIVEKSGRVLGSKFVFSSEHPIYKLVQNISETIAENYIKHLTLPNFGLSNVKIKITLLKDIYRLESIKDIKIGEQGLYLEWGTNRVALFPSEAIEFGWDAESCVRRLYTKAGVPLHLWLYPEVEIYYFNVLTFED